MRKRKLIAGTTLALLISLAFSATAFAMSQQNQQNQQQQNQPFYNTQNNNNLSDASQYMVNQGIIKGNPNGQYDMSDHVRRCDLMIMLMRAFGLQSNQNNCDFGDVSTNKYYFNAVQTAQELGVAKVDGHNFHPETPVTLEQAIAFVERAMDVMNIDSDIDLEALFEDRDLSEYATREDVATMLFAILDGKTTTTSSNVVSYETDEETAITFDEDDFNDIYEEATGESLDYIKFTLPSSTYGTLYYDYEDDDEDTVGASEKYYYDDSPSISNVTFVPADNYSGTVKIYYTGYNTDKDQISGVIKIKITD